MRNTFLCFGVLFVRLVVVLPILILMDLLCLIVFALSLILKFLLLFPLNSRIFPCLKLLALLVCPNKLFISDFRQQPRPSGARKARRRTGRNPRSCNTGVTFSSYPYLFRRFIS